MNPFSCRCCQHNHTQGWPYYAEHLVLATPDNGAALALYASCQADITVGNNQKIKLIEKTNYPFEESIQLLVQTEKNVDFPLYLRIPSWSPDASIKINGKKVKTSLIAGQYVRIQRTWSNDDVIELNVPMHLNLRTWQVNKNSVSIDYGPLTFSLKIQEKYIKRDSRQTAIGDSQWQNDAGCRNWPH